jgi:hypothetical protein
MTQNEKSSRRWLQFGLRSLLIVIFLAALVSIWVRSRMLIEHLYDVSDLLDDSRSPTSVFEQWGTSLSDLIEPDSWGGPSGYGSITELDENRLLILQYPATHRLIDSLFSALRSLPLLDEDYKPQTARILVGIQHDADNNQLQIVIYPVGDIIIDRAFKNPRRASFGRLMNDLAEIDPLSWIETGGPGCLMKFQQRGALVISNTKAVHDQIAAALAAMRAENAAAEPAANEPAK